MKSLEMALDNMGVINFPTGEHVEIEYLPDGRNYPLIRLVE